MTHEEQVNLRLEALQLASKMLNTDHSYLTVELANIFYNWMFNGKVPSKDEQLQFIKSMTYIKE